MKCFRAISTLLLALAPVVATAQLDTRLQTCKTDVLDVYTGGTSAAAKPEIITLIDNSGSMNGVYWSKLYYADADRTSTQGSTGQSIHNNVWGLPAGDFQNRVVPVVYSSGSGSSISVWVNLHEGKAIDPSPGNVVSGLKNGILIKPNGDPVVYSDVNSTDVKLWVQRASHVRFSFASSSSAVNYSYVKSDGTTGTYAVGNLNIKPRPYSGGAGGNYTSYSATDIKRSDKIRVVDLPLPWALFDAVPYYEGQNRSLSPAPQWPTGGNGNYADAVAKKHPQHTYIFDKVPDSNGNQTSKAQWYEVDGIWSQGFDGNDGILQPWTGATSAKGKIGCFNYGADYLMWIAFGQDVRNATDDGITAYTGTNAGSYAVKDVREGGAAWNNQLPGMTRFMAIKRCLIQTWVDNQLDVEWALRFFYGDPDSSSGTTAPTQYDSNNTNGNPGDRELLKLTQPTSANNPDERLRYVITMRASGSTPLTNGVMNAYAQFANTNTGNSVFPKDVPSCTQSYLIILSDGGPTDAGGDSDPYATGVANGNKAVATNPSYIKGARAYNNFYTLAGIAAHYPTSSSISGMPTDNYSANVKVPWVITSRPSGITRRISTMTIGVSLEGNLNDTYGAKKAMYAAALYGWEKRTTPWDINNNPPPSYNPLDPNAADKQKNPFYFDGKDPDGLSDALSLAFGMARSATNTMGSPVAPLVGLNVGRQTYVGTFITNQSSVWTGDLLMTGLSVLGNQINILDKNGAVLAATSGLNAGNAAWSAADALATRGWNNRKIYTLSPSSATTFTNTLVAWNESLTSSITNAMLGVSSDTERRSLIRFMMGASLAAQADTSANSSITGVRADIMGDIINSTPVILEFPTSAIPSGSSLATFHSDFKSHLTDIHFRLIIVGDNQGLLHGFGEVSGIPKATETVGGRPLVQGVVEGAVDELWAFLPPDFLGGLQAWRNGTTHRFLMDGSPTVYFNEAGTRNGMVDGNDVVRILVGLRKGGRSLYCLTFTNNDPTQLQVAWKIRPDEIAPTDTTSPNQTLKTLGFSSSTPTISRIRYGGVLTDVFLMGGGLTTPEVDTAFSAATTATPPGYGSGTKLGRSVLALNVRDGSVVKVWDFAKDATLKSAFPSMGCIPASVTPVEAISNSNSTQRVYFTDTSGGAYVLGAMAASGSRSDTMNMDSWSVRRLYTPKYAGTAVSVAPVVFNLPYGFPVARTTAPKAIVPTWGVVFGTGDRNDPMDLDSVNPGGGGTSYRNRLLVVLDRQDSADITGTLGPIDTKGLTDDDLADLTAIASSSGTAVDSSQTNYYLKTKFGYYLNYTVGTQKSAYVSAQDRYAYQKTVTPSVVLNRVLFFSTYTPEATSTACSGSGYSYSFRMCDVLAPVFNNGAQAVATPGSLCDNGWYGSFNDISSEMATIGLAGVLQTGEVRNGATGSGTIGTQPGPGKPPSTMPRIRAWRIIR
ncbi:pilus assembly protein [Mesoterricola sediminis]|uniref:Type IV pilus assembly protein PilY1 n=1 Tax=Mesoterricola sediminis TaxID=2927980 RepID=A0AA48GTG8_9BACT|nr:hypothetical protein [Mesoterricola sediminis]BDU77424.1 hypothetical protein METESE_23820 [Mesoterricola sediminis]